MYSFLLNANSLLWNNDFLASQKIVDETKGVCPTSCILNVQSIYLKYAITGNPKILEEVTASCMNIVDLIQALKRLPKKREKLVKIIAKKNANLGKIDLEMAKERKVDPMIDEKKISNSLDVDLEVDLACVSLLSGMIQMFFKKLLVAGKHLKRAWKSFEKLYKEHITGGNKKEIGSDTLEKIIFGYGVFVFIVGYFPNFIGKVMKFVGFKADREKGEIALVELIKKKSFMLGFSIYCLFKYSSFFENLAVYHPILKLSIELFPKQSIFRLLASQVADEEGKYNESIEHLMIAVDSCKGIAKDYMPLNYIFELGVHYLFTLEFDLALKQFELMDRKPYRFDNFVYVALAVIYSRKKDKDKTLGYFEKCKTSTSSKGDKFSKFLMSFLNLIESSKSDIDVVYAGLSILHCLCFYIRRDLDHAEKDLLTFIEKDLETQTKGLKNVDLKVWLSFLKGKIAKQTEEDETCLSTFVQTLALEKKITKEVKKELFPFLHFELGELYFFKGTKKDYKTSMDYLKKVKQGSSFHEDLSRKVKTASAQLKELSKK